MKEVILPAGFRLESLQKSHERRKFRSGQTLVDDWLANKALQHQKKHLSVTKVLLDECGQIAGFYTLATSEVDFGDLPLELARRLPRRRLPVAVLAWLGVRLDRQGQGLGDRLLAIALRDCYLAGKTFAFVAVLLDCVSDAAKAFYKKRDFKELPGHPSRLFVSAGDLSAMMEGNA